MAISDYNTDASLNVTIGGADLEEGCNPAGINNAIRQVMADLALFDDQYNIDFGRTLTVPIGEAGSSVPIVSERANKVMLFGNLGQAGAASFSTVYDGTEAVIADNRVILAAMTGVADGQAVVLTEPRREGIFVFHTGNFSTSVSNDPNQGIYVAPASDVTGASGAWARKYPGQINAKWFGATGDGVTNDTVTIQAGLDFISALGGGTLYFPEGTFVTSAYLTAHPKTLIRGAGRFSTKITSAHAGGGGANASENLRNGSCFRSSATINASNPVFIGIEDLCIENTNAANVGAGYYDTGGTYIHMHNVRVLGFKFGLVLEQTELADFDLCGFESQTAGGGGAWLVDGNDLTAAANPGFTNRISISRSQFDQNPTNYGIIDDGGGLHSYVDNNYNGGLNAIRGTSMAAAIVRGGEFESQTGAIIDLFSTKLSGAGGGGNSVFVDGGFFSATVGNAAIRCNAGAGTLGVGGTAGFAGGGGTHPIVGCAVLSQLWLGSTANFTALPTLCDGPAQRHTDTTDVSSTGQNRPSTVPGTGYLTSPGFKVTTSDAIDGHVATLEISHLTGGQVYLQSLLDDDATGFCQYVVRTSGGDGMGERFRANFDGFKLPATKGFYVGGNKVLGDQGAAIADGVNAAAAPTQAEFNALVTVVNTMLARMRAASPSIAT